MSLIQSNYLGFGSGTGAGRSRLRPAKPRHPVRPRRRTTLNRLEPHKRPFHTIIPAMVTKDGKPWFVFGVMGGDMQPQGQVQVLVNLIDFGMNVQEAGEAPRIEHVGSATPTGQPGDADGGTVSAEARHPGGGAGGAEAARPSASARPRPTAAAIRASSSTRRRTCCTAARRLARTAAPRATDGRSGPCIRPECGAVTGTSRVVGVS